MRADVDGIEEHDPLVPRRRVRVITRVRKRAGDSAGKTVGRAVSKVRPKHLRAKAAASQRFPEVVEDVTRRLPEGGRARVRVALDDLVEAA